MDRNLFKKDGVWRNMKINNDLLGKEVVDESGDQVGVVKEVEWDAQSNKVTGIVLKEGGVSAKLGLGDKEMVPYENIRSIGDNVLVKGRLFKTK
jgi:sporulation protein YlmC with PRC-barrel domain